MIIIIYAKYNAYFIMLRYLTTQFWWTQLEHYSLLHTLETALSLFYKYFSNENKKKRNIVRALWRAYSSPIDHIDARECHAWKWKYCFPFDFWAEWERGEKK